MDILTAHAYFAGLPDSGRSHLPEDAGIPDEETLPLFATAAAELSGMLDDAESIEDIHEAMEHFITLFSAEIIDCETWNTAAAEVFETLESWATKQPATATAEMN